jgi:hypothetical protein
MCVVTIYCGVEGGWLSTKMVIGDECNVLPSPIESQRLLPTPQCEHTYTVAPAMT